MMRYTFLGDRLTAPQLRDVQCDPVRREDGKCIVSTRMAAALVELADGTRLVVPRRMLRVNRSESCTPSPTA